jgi:hypothetical protein
MTSKNDITGDAIRTDSPSDAYRENYDRIFGKKKKDQQESKKDLPIAYDGKCDLSEESTKAD